MAASGSRREFANRWARDRRGHGTNPPTPTQCQRVCHTLDNFAILEFDKALKWNPNGARSYLVRGWAHYDACQLNEAAPDFEHAVSEDAALRGEIYSPQKIQNRRQECAILAEQARRAALQPPPRPAGPNIGQWYEREWRANAAEASGNHEAARIIRESMP